MLTAVFLWQDTKTSIYAVYDTIHKARVLKKNVSRSKESQKYSENQHHAQKAKRKNDTKPLVRLQVHPLCRKETNFRNKSHHQNLSKPHSRPVPVT